METFRSMRDWVRRHKKGLLFSAGALGAGYICYRVVKAHSTRLQTELEESEVGTALLRQAAQRAEAQLRSHFHVVQRISDATTLPSILPVLDRQLLNRLDTSGLIIKLGSQDLTLEDKLELWQDIKILSFARVTCSMWALTLLVLLLRVQVNIIGRHVYLDTARDYSNIDIGDRRRALPISCQRNYMAFYEFLPHRGLEMLISDAKLAIQSVVGSKPLQEPCTIANLREMLDCIFGLFENGKVNWLHYMLPSDDVLSDEEIAAFLSTEPDGYSAMSRDDAQQVEQLLSETKVILDSEEFKNVIKLSFDVVLNEAMQLFGAMYQERSTTSIPFVKLLSLVSRAGSVFFEEEFEQKIIEVITSQPQLQSFCAMVYSAGD